MAFFLTLLSIAFCYLSPADMLPTSAPVWAAWLCAFSCAGLLYLCYFPVAVGVLAWVALVPLFVLVKLPGRPRFLYLSCWLAAMAFHWSATR